MSKLETDCEGCRGRIGCVPSNANSTCSLKSHYIDQQGNKIVCPCSICLVKGICKELCDDIQLYYYSYHSRKDKGFLKLNTPQRIGL